MTHALSLGERSRTFVPIHNNILNRVGIINEIHGCHYDYCYGNPCTVRHRLGWYSCLYFGDLIAQWQSFDVDGVKLAFAKLDALAEALWLVRKAGKLRLQR